MTDDLFKLEGEAEEIGVGQTFAPSGWIAPMQAIYLYGVGYVDFDLAQIVLDHQTGELDTILDETGEGMDAPWGVLLEKNGEYYDSVRHSENTSKWKFYFLDRARAQVFCKMMDLERPMETSSGRKFSHRPDQIWRYECRIADTLTLTEEGKGKFEDDVMGWENIVRAPMKKSKEWHLYHGMALPSFVAAYANMMGWDNTGFSLEELLIPDDDLVFTDEFQILLIGNTDMGFDASRFWSRRKLLWDSLGESNPKASNPIGSKRNATESEKLSQALNVALSTWSSPVYCRVIQVRDPRVDASYQSGSSEIVRPRVAVITDIYKSKKLAQSATDAERATWQEDGDDNGAVAKPSKPAVPDGSFVPEAWEGMPDDWAEEVAKFKAEFDGKAKPIVKKALKERESELAETLMVTVEDVMKALE